MQFKKWLTSVVSVAGLFALSSPAQAVPFIFPVTSVPGNATFSGTGPGLPPTGGSPAAQFTVVGNFAATDTIRIDVSGTVDIATGENGVGYVTNAAGVTVNPLSSIYNTLRGRGTVATSPTFPAAPLNSPYGSLLLSVDNFATSAVVPFVANAANGLGQPVVPTNLSFTGTVGSLFGGPIANGTVFSFRVSDVNTGDSTGSFTVSGFLSDVPPGAPEIDGSQATVPLACCLLSLLVLGGRRRAGLAI